MSAVDMVRQWQHTVKHNLLSSLHGHQAKALALLSWTMAMAGNCCAGAIAPLAPAGTAKPASVRRRMERLLANDRLNAVEAMLDLSSSILSGWGGRKLLLILDETPKANDLRCMKLSVGYHKRTVTLLSVCYPPDHPPMPMPKLVRRMLRQVAACLPQDVTVTLLADRGLCWPTIIRQCKRLGWHYLLGLQSDTRVHLADGTEKAVSELADCRGARWLVRTCRCSRKPAGCGPMSQRCGKSLPRGRGFWSPTPAPAMRAAAATAREPGAKNPIATKKVTGSTGSKARSTTRLMPSDWCC